MKTLVAVMGCLAHDLNGYQQASRDTWVQDVSQLGDFKVFVGRGNQDLLDDEIQVDVSDDKEHLLYKVVELLRWALDRNYDRILKIDNDTYINISEMAKQDYSGFDYIGTPVGMLGEFYAGTEAYSFLQGSATWLSARAAKVVIDEVIDNTLKIQPNLMKYNGLICPYPHSEDLWIAQVLTPRLKSGELCALPDKGYSNGPLTFHFALNKEQFDMPSWMHQLHQVKPNIDSMVVVHNNREKRIT